MVMAFCQPLVLSFEEFQKVGVGWPDSHDDRKTSFESFEGLAQAIDRFA
jgi:hypothetical protein